MSLTLLVNADIYNYTTRHASDIHLTSHKTKKFGIYGLDHFHILCFNKLPLDIRQSVSLSQFEQRLKIFMSNSDNLL